MLRPVACTFTVSVAAMAGLLPAQEAATERLPTPAPVFEMVLAGPAAIRAAFLPTNVGGMLASAEGERLWRPLVDQVDGWFRAQIGDEGFAAGRERLLGFAGHARLCWFAGPGEDDQATGVLVLEGGKPEVLDALAEDLDALLAKVAPGEDLRLRVGEQEFTGRTEGGDAYSRPQRLGGRVVTVFADDVGLDAAIPMALAFLAQAPGARATTPMSMTIDLGQLVDRFGPKGDDRAAWRDTFGLASLGRLTMTLAPRGPRCELEFTLAFRRPERGVFAALMPAAAGMPALLDRLPKGVTPWKCGPLSLPAFYRTMIETIAAEQHGTDADGIAKVKKEIETDLGFDPDADCFAYLGDEVLVLGDFWDEGDLERVAHGRDPQMGFCLVFPVRDDQAFGSGLDRLFAAARASSMQVRSRETRNGLDVRTIGNMFTPEFLVASGKGLGMIAFGDEGARLLDAMATAQPDPGAAKELWERMRRDQPPGVNGIAVADLRALCGGQLPILLEILGDSLPARANDIVPPRMLPELLMQLAPLLERHHLDQVVSFSGFAADTYHWRLLW